MRTMTLIFSNKTYDEPSVILGQGCHTLRHTYDGRNPLKSLNPSYLSCLSGLFRQKHYKFSGTKKQAKNTSTLVRGKIIYIYLFSMTSMTSMTDVVNTVSYNVTLPSYLSYLWTYPSFPQRSASGGEPRHPFPGWIADAIESDRHIHDSLDGAVRLDEIIQPTVATLQRRKQ